MAITADVHVHTSFSGDSDAPMETQVLAALKQGLTALCFTEHLDYDFPYDSSPDLPKDCFLIDHDAYRSEYLRLRDSYKDRIRLLFGLEMGLQPHLKAENNEYLRRHQDFDMVIGSTHVSQGMDPYYPAFFEGKSTEEAYRIYFAESLENIRTFHDFDTYGHMDYIVRYGQPRDESYCFAKYSDVITPILEALLEYDIALEVNTSAVRRAAGVTAGAETALPGLNPHISVLRQYYKMGGRRITIGSDAHTPGRVANSFPALCSVLRDLGFTHYEVFEGRVPSAHRL